MTRTRFTSLFACLSFTAALTACSGDDTKTSAASDTNDTSSSSSSSDTATSTTAGSTTTAATTASSESDSGTGTTGSTTATSVTTTTTGAVPQPNGSPCSSDEECESESCYLVPLLGGLCGECKTDDDCDGGGCTIPNPLKGVGASCNKGGAGDGCGSDEVCVDPAAPYCGVVVNAKPIITVMTCGECKTNAECTDPKMPNCNPVVSVADFNGQLSCVEDGSIPNDKACNLAENGGHKACESGKCTTAVLETVVKIGICGECLADADCPAEKPKCVDAAVDTNNGDLFGAKCSA